MKANCADGTCGQCPKCYKEKMKEQGYSEQEIRTVITTLAYKEKKGLWANIHAKRKRIEAGSGERMRRPGEKGAPSAKALKDAGKDAKKK